MGPFCAWETAFYLARGDVRRARRRAVSGGLAQVGRAQLPVWYPSPRTLAADFSPHFRAVGRAAGVGSLLPPSYLARLVERSPACVPERWPNRAIHAPVRAVGRPLPDGLRTSMMAFERQLWRTALAWRFRLFQRHRYRRLVLEHVDGLDLVVLPQVFNPKLLRSGELFVEFLSRSDLVRPTEKVLDLGTGSRRRRAGRRAQGLRCHCRRHQPLRRPLRAHQRPVERPRKPPSTSAWATSSSPSSISAST